MYRNVKKCNFNEMMLSAANPASLLMIFGSSRGARDEASRSGVGEQQAASRGADITMTYDDNWPHVPWIHTVIQSVI